MEISVEPIEEPDYNYFYYAYTVHVENHRILTVFTDCDFTVSKWLKEVQKTTNTNTKRLAPALVVGVAADCKSGLKDDPYDLLQLCTGSHCLLYHLPSPGLRALMSFFSNPKVIAVGMNMKSVAKKLECDYDIKFENVVDLNELAVKNSTGILEKEFMDLGSYDLDQLAEAVLGRCVYVVRPEKKVKWFDTDSDDMCCFYNVELTQEKVKYATADSYLCFMIGWELLHLPVAKSLASASKEKKKKNKNKKK